MLHLSDTGEGNHWDGDVLTDMIYQFYFKAAIGAVLINTVQDLSKCPRDCCGCYMMDEGGSDRSIYPLDMLTHIRHDESSEFGKYT